MLSVRWFFFALLSCDSLCNIFTDALWILGVVSAHTHTLLAHASAIALFFFCSVALNSTNRLLILLRWWLSFDLALLRATHIWKCVVAVIIPFEMISLRSRSLNQRRRKKAHDNCYSIIASRLRERHQPTNQLNQSWKIKRRRKKTRKVNVLFNMIVSLVKR